MRLINTKTFALREFFELNEIYRETGNEAEAQHDGYAILSHTWGEEEITFQDWLYVTNQYPVRSGWVHNEEDIRVIEARKGYIKVKEACKQAQRDGYSWIWIDTVCIDKLNLPELTEAINSMVLWYEKAQVCYAFLADVPPASLEDCKVPGSKFRRSRWFTRGWTLQELIAPRHVDFFSDSWTPLCQLYEIIDTVHEITNINTRALGHTEREFRRRGRFATAEIMLWASSRTTTRPEDMAYCLIGLFDINMPLLYGEGKRAFLRLQLELIKMTSDLTFLIWEGASSLPLQVTGSMIQPRQEIAMEDDEIFYRFQSSDTLAWEPKMFSSSKGIYPASSPANSKSLLPSENMKEMRVTNLGLSLSLPIVETLESSIRFAVLPYRQDYQDIWMPLFGKDQNHLRFGLPQPILCVPSIAYTGKETEITLPIYKLGQDQLPFAIQCRRAYSGSWKASNCNILLTFPATLGEYKYYRRFPHPKNDNFDGEIFLPLCFESAVQTIAYGAIEFHSFAKGVSGLTSRRVAIFFAVELELDESSKSSTAKRWTCIDISPSVSNIHAFDLDLDARARRQMAALAENDIWLQNVPLTASRGEKYDHGAVLLGRDTCRLDPSPDEEPIFDDVLSKVDEPGFDPSFIVAQIIFPGQRSKKS